MGGVSIWHWLVVGLIVLLLFGRGKISEMMGDVAKGIKAFKKGMSEEERRRRRRQPAPSEPVGPSSTRRRRGGAERRADGERKVGCRAAPDRAAPPARSSGQGRGPRHVRHELG